MEQTRAQSRAVRLNVLKRKLYCSPVPVKVQDLAGQLDVTPRTIYRDLKDLEGEGVPVYPDEGGFLILKEGYHLPISLIINRNEAMALFIATRLLSHFTDEYNPHIVSALEQMAAGIQDQTIARHIQRAAKVIKDRRQNPGFVETVKILTQAWAEQRKVQITYRSGAGEETERVICPYFLEPSSSGNSLYVMAFDELRGDLRTFKVERIKTATLMNGSYQIPPDYDPYQHLSSCWGVMWGEEEVEVRLRFTAAVAPRVKENVWHHSQAVEDIPGGGCRLKVRVGNPLEMKPWIRSWGADVEVEAPASLRGDIAGEARRMAELYK